VILEEEVRSTASEGRIEGILQPRSEGRKEPV